jgi:histidinol-phosphate aminotransferase
MSDTRREFLRRLGAGGAVLALGPALAGRGHEAALASAAPVRPLTGQPIRLDSNENPYGPSPEALEAIRRSLTEASRYPDQPEEVLREAIARVHGLSPDWVLLGCGSTEILRIAVAAFSRADRPLVSAAPTFEAPATMARTVGAPVIAVPVDRELRLDLEAMARAGAPNAGLIFCCNPNNPTGTVHGAEAIRRFVAATHAASPEATILIDEAYHEYVDDPSYRTALPLAQENPRVMVARTLSKVYGLAGIRAGYVLARPETIAQMAPWRLPSGISVTAGAAAVAALASTRYTSEQQRLNRETRAFTRQVFEELGFAPGPSDTNFLMVDIKRDTRAFKAACLTQGVAVGRAFPPFLTHTRVSIGTMPEMRRAAEVFRAVLSKA